MENTTRWELIVNESRVALWVSDVVPLSLAHATEEELFGKVIDFTNATVAIHASAKIVSAKSEPTGTTFELSVA